MKRKKRLITGVIAAILLVGAILGGKYIADLTYYKKVMSEITIGSINLENITDGTYVGSYDARITAATVRVTVKDGIITDIRLLDHKYERDGSAESILKEIMEEQSLDVDVVSGATNSCKTILKAVENALRSGLAAED